eukprot:TRINITY_DN21678_c0_g6_i1.p1 TRINITY_DN21678_c0_g6~~TRINITY_DN21678_c0_g6_i1.p1  ORF type:complete len:828 (+),score=90.54 TRINITY_DN21678_c0_g6_i1:92-2485(+)
MPAIKELRSSDAVLKARSVWECILQNRRLSQTSTGSGFASSETERFVDLAALASALSWCPIIRFGEVREQVMYDFLRVLALVELWLVPFVISFDCVYPIRGSPIPMAMDAVLTTLFALGVVARLRTTFISLRDLSECTEPIEIIRAVSSHWTFLADCIAIATSPLLHIRMLPSVIGLLRLGVTWRLPRSSHRIMLLSYASSDVLPQLAQLLVAVFYTTHIYGCIWFVAKVYSPPDYGHEWSSWNGWSRDVFSQKDADEGSLSIPLGEYGNANDLAWCYARALRDGVYMLVGWAGPNAISAIELVVICIMGPLSGCVTACVYAVCVSTVQQHWILDSRFAEQKELLNAACSGMKLNQDLRSRVCRYHSFLSMHHMGQEADDFFSRLSPNLFCEMRIVRMKGILQHAGIFQGLAPRIILLLVQACVQTVFSPGDYVVRKGETADCMYLIMRGTLSVLVDDAATHCVSVMQEGECFGEICFLKDVHTRTAWVRADTFVTLSRLDKDCFEEVLANDEHTKCLVILSIMRKLGNMKGVQEIKSHMAGMRSQTLTTLAEIHEGTEECIDALESANAVSIRRSVSNQNSNRSCDEEFNVWATSSASTPLMSDRDGDEQAASCPPEAHPRQAQQPSTIEMPIPSAFRRGSAALAGPSAERLRRMTAGLARAASKQTAHEPQVSGGKLETQVAQLEETVKRLCTHCEKLDATSVKDNGCRDILESQSKQIESQELQLKTLTQLLVSQQKQLEIQGGQLKAQNAQFQALRNEIVSMNRLASQSQARSEVPSKTCLQELEHDGRLLDS